MNSLPEDLERLLTEVADELEAAFHPLLVAGRDPVALNRFLHQIGWDLESLLGTDPGTLAESIETLYESFRAAIALVKLAESVDEIGPGVIRALEALRDFSVHAEGVLEGVAKFNAASPEHHSRLAGALVRDTGEHLLLRFLAKRAPLVLALSRLVGFIGPRQMPALYPGENQSTGKPLRFPILRPAINDKAMTQAVMLPVRAIADNLGPEAFGSIDAFFRGVNRSLARMMAPVFPYLEPGEATEMEVTVSLDGISIQVPGVFPVIDGIDPSMGFSIPLKRVASQAAGEATVEPAEFPVLVIQSSGLALNWSSPDTADEIPLIDGMLYLADSFGGTAVSDPGIRFHLDISDPANPGAKLTLAAALRLVAGDVSNRIGLEFNASLNAAGAFSLEAVAEAYPDLVVPIGFPGLEGMALTAAHPVLRAGIAHGVDFGLRITLEAEAFGIRLPTALARKATRVGTVWQIEDQAPEIRFSLTGGEPKPIVDVRFSAETRTPPSGLRIAELSLIEPEDGNALHISSDAVFIGFDSPRQGFIIEVAGFDWQFSEGSSLTGGIAIEKAVVHFPEALEVIDSIEITQATFNDRGFSGAVSVLFDENASSESESAPSGGSPESVRPKPLFGVLPIQLYSLHLEFVENVPVAFDLKAAIELPYFDEWVDLTIGIDDRFNIVFRLDSTDPEGIVLTKEELLSITFRSAGFEYLHDIRMLRLTLSGGLEPLLWNADGLQWPRIDITNLVLEQDLAALPPAPVEPPVIKFEEAWLDLKDLATLDLFGFQFELNRIGVGYVETTDKLWVDLTGSLRLIDLIPIGIGVEGFRITWPRRIYEELGIGTGDLTVDDLLRIAGRIEVKFDGVYLFFGVPQTVEFEGYIRFLKEAQKIGFAGDVALRVPASGLAIEAGLMVGMNFADPPYPFLYVYFGILLPSGIPLGQSGLALKGAKGLFGLNVYPDRTPEQNPYYDWYKRGPIEGAHPTNKWRDQIWSIAFGAGITITTTDGKILGVQGLLALVIPGPIIFIEGKALIFDGVFPGDGPLKALAYFDGNELTAQFNIEAGMELVEGVIDVNAGLEAFFDFKNLANWHLYLGKDEPPERRVRANILKLPVVGWLFEANSYLMLDMQDEDTLQARLGVHIGFEPPAVDLVVASAEVRAVIEGSGLLTVNPFQFNGRLALDAVVDVQAFGFLIFGVEASAHVDVEGALPFVVDARVKARVDLPLPDFEEVPVVGDWASSVVDWFEETVAEIPEIPEYIQVEVPFHWEFDGPPKIDPLVRTVSLESALIPGAVQALEAGGDVGLPESPVVPLDARPTVIFDQNVNQGEDLSFGGFSSGRVQRFFSGKLAFRPYLREVTLWRLPVHLFDPATGDDAQAWQLVGRASASQDAERLWGAFRPEIDGGDAGRCSRRVLDLWRANVFEFLNGTIPLALPSDDAHSDRVPVSFADGLLGPGGLRWCMPGSAGEDCITGDHFMKMAENKDFRPVWIADGIGFRHKLTIRNVDFLADDLRILFPGGADTPFPQAHDKTVKEPVLRASARPRQRIKLVIRFPEPVVSVTLILPKENKTRIRAEARRGEPVRFVESSTGRRKGVAPRIGTPCAVTVPATVKEKESVLQIDGKDWFDCLQLTADGDVDLVRLCWVTAAEAEAAVIREAECRFNAGLGDHGGEVPVVLTAGSYYRLEVTTSITLDEEVSDWTTLALCGSIPAFSETIAPYRAQNGSTPETSRFYFQTAGPPQDLGRYVKWISPRHQSTGHFFDDDLVIRFNRSYIHRLYPDPDTSIGPADFPHAIEALLRDAEGHVIRGFFHNWTTAGSPTLFPGERKFLEAVEGSSSPVEPPPPDDILEIRRAMFIRSGADLGAEAWEILPLDATGSRSPKWKRQPDGSVKVTSAGNEGGSLFVLDGYDWTDCRLEVTVKHDASESGELGVIFGFASPKDFYRLKIRKGVKPTVNLAKIREGREIFLAEEPFIAPKVIRGQGLAIPGPNIPVRIHIVTRSHAGGLAIIAAAGGSRLEASDSLPPQGGSRIGFYARGANVEFSGLSVMKPRQELIPDARYTLMLTGGEGGRTIFSDDFSGPGLVDRWIADPTSWVTGDGLHAMSPGSRIALRDSVEDCELVTALDMKPGEAVRILLRSPDALRATGNDTAYELFIKRESTGCEVIASASTGPQGVVHSIGAGHAALGGTDRFPLRVRLIGDTLRVWIFHWLLIDVVLEEYVVEVISAPAARHGQATGTRNSGLNKSASGIGVTIPSIGTRIRRLTIPRAWSGAVEWIIAAGLPTIRSVDLRRPELLNIDFTTSRYASFAEPFEHAETAGEALVAPGYPFSQYAADIQELAQTQHLVADARIALLAAQARFAATDADREAMETARQREVRLTADHSERFTTLLSRFYVPYGAAPDVPTIQRLETEDGQWLGYLLRSPEPLEPELFGLPDSEPFASTGRTRFSLTALEGISDVPTGWISSGDGTALIIYQREGQGDLGNHTPIAETAPVVLVKRAYVLDVEYIRHHHDDTAGIDHLYDRPYLLSHSSTGNEFVSGIPCST
jgi:hypothetical protein